MGTSTTVIQAQDVSKRFVIRKDKSLKERVVNLARSNRHRQDFWALRHVNLEIASGSTVGLVGANGSGKSTLLKIIGGIIQPTSGSVMLRGRVAALLELGAGFHPDLTGRENVFLNASILGLSRNQTQRHFDAMVEFSGIGRFIDTQVKFYSSGMYVRLAFAVAIHVDPDILLVDEVLAVGDEPFQRKCMNKIRAFQNDGRTIVFVSHSLGQVADLCDRAVVLEDGEVVADGPPLEALRVLRAEFEVTRASDRDQERRSEETPRTSATITSVHITDYSGASSDSIAPGDDLLLRVEVDAPDGLSDWVLGVGIDTPMGQVVLGTNTNLIGIQLPAITGRQVFEVCLPQLWIGEGQYTVHGAIALGTGVEIFRLPEAATFSVRSDGRTLGYLYAKPELRLISP